MEKKSKPEHIKKRIAALEAELRRIEDTCTHDVENLSAISYEQSSGQAAFLGTTIKCLKCGLSVSSKVASHQTMFKSFSEKLENKPE